MKTPNRNKTLMTVAAALLLAVPCARAADNTGTGGTITYTDASGLNPTNTPIVGGYVVHTFTVDGMLNVPVPATADVLVVGGGGGGGGATGGGGGAGGYIYSNSVSVVGGSNYTVTVGAGGAGGSGNAQGTNGGDSVFGSLLTASGGGGGGNNMGIKHGKAGGSGGGASSDGTSGTAGAGSSGQGNAGGTAGPWGGNYPCGGGGGAGGVGGNGNSSLGGLGGPGLTNSITGSSVAYAGGGGGGVYQISNGGTGGAGGGGNGGTTGGGATSGAANTGGGGGGQGGNVGTAAGAGGSGIVIVRYPYDDGSTFVSTLSSPTDGQSFDYTTSIAATAAFSNGTAPYTVNFYLDGSGTPVSTTSGATSPLTVNLPVTPGSHTVYATVTDNTSTVVTSGTHSFTVAPASTACDITAFDANLAGSSAVITNLTDTTGTVVVTVPFATTEAEVAALAPSYTLSAFATCPQPNPGIPTPDPLSTTTPVHYIVTAQSGAQKDYTVTVIRTPASTACDMLTFDANLAGSSAIITNLTGATGTVDVTVPFGTTPTQVAALAPSYTLSTFATCPQPNPGIPTPDPLSTTTPVHYIVTAQSGAQKDYTVTVNVAASPHAAPIPGTGWNQDTIVEATATNSAAGIQAVTTTGIGGTFVLTEQGFAGVGSGTPLPSSGVLTTIKGTVFQLASYTGNNSFTDTVGGTGIDGTFTLTTPGRYSSLQFFVHGIGDMADGDNFFATVNFSDASSTVLSFHVHDWQSSQSYNALGSKSDYARRDGGSPLALWTRELQFPLSFADQAKTITSIDFVLQDRLGVAAVSGEAIGVAAGYPGWADTNAPGQTPDQDYDDDGVQNGLEYFMGQTGSSFTAMPGLDGTNTVTWPKDPAYNGTWQVQTSPDLVNWTDVAGTEAGDGTSVSYTLTSGEGKKFVRLLVTPTL